MALRISCGELQQLLAMQKAITTERDSEILHLRAVASDCAELDDAQPCQQAVYTGQPVTLLASALAELRSPPPCQHAERPHQPLMSLASSTSSTVPQAMQREGDAKPEDAGLLDNTDQLAGQEHAQSLLSQQLADCKVAQLRAALAASERHRERQAALHKQQVEALISSMQQVRYAMMRPAVQSLTCGLYTFCHVCLATRSRAVQCKEHD